MDPTGLDSRNGTSGIMFFWKWLTRICRVLLGCGEGGFVQGLGFLVFDCCGAALSGVNYSRIREIVNIWHVGLQRMNWRHTLSFAAYAECSE